MIEGYEDNDNNCSSCSYCWHLIILTFHIRILYPKILSREIPTKILTPKSTFHTLITYVQNYKERLLPWGIHTFHRKQKHTANKSRNVRTLRKIRLINYINLKNRGLLNIIWNFRGKKKSINWYTEKKW